MSRRLVAINAALVLVGLIAVGYTVRELRTESRAATVRPSPAAQPPSAPGTSEPVTPAGGYGAVASRNLFSPTRSEAPPSAVAAGPAQPKPQLYGIILREQTPVAYLEDPATKRVAGYRIGDAVAGGTIKTIANDHVVLNRPEGEVNVGLRDPSKPRPAAPPAPPAAAAPGGQAPPGAPGVPVAPGAAAPGTVPPVAATPGVPGTATPPGTPGAVQPLPQSPNALPPLPRRPLPPNLLRRLPPTGTDAPAQN